MKDFFFCSWYGCRSCQSLLEGHRASRSLAAGHVGIAFMRGVGGLYVVDFALSGIGGVVGSPFARLGRIWNIGLG